MKNMVGKIWKQQAKLLDRHLKGAWMAGFDYLYVLTDRDYPLEVNFIPTNVKLDGIEKRPNPNQVVERYDLHNLSVEEYTAAIESVPTILQGRP